jgi:hypothetical protein
MWESHLQRALIGAVLEQSGKAKRLRVASGTSEPVSQLNDIRVNESSPVPDVWGSSECHVKKREVQ